MGYRQRHSIPDLGVGVGLRGKHLPSVLREHPAMDWFEIISENYFADGGAPRANLDAARSHYRLVPHGVSLSIGGTDPLDADHLARLRRLVRHIDAPWCSDHLCWTGAAGIDVHDLLPVPYTKASLAHVVERVRRVQGEVEAPFALENASSYLAYRESTMAEHQFLAELAERADCGILLDVNNVFVSAYNHGFDADAYIEAIPADRVVQIHLAGHVDRGTHLLDTHSDHVCDGVWRLFRRAIQRCGAVSTLVEWDEEIPPWEVLAAEASLARTARADALRSTIERVPCETPAI
jgi:uncharacterized protein (UPF0276 family)